MRLGNREFDLEGYTPYVMGILNVTPDSFSDGGSFNTLDRALKHAEEMITEGADIIDIGGESTRPGYTVVPVEEEIERTAPVIEAIKARFDVPVTLDTYKAGVAEAGLKAGADMINDIWGLKADDKLAGVIAASENPGVILMHNRKEAVYNDLIADVKDDLRECIKIAVDAGIPEDRLILDPGIGFGKTLEHNLAVMKYLGDIIDEFKMPMLLGVSRKSMIGLTLDLPVDERLEGTIAVNVAGYISGCRIFRVHDVKAHRRALDMIAGIQRV